MPTYNDFDELYAGLMANLPAAVWTYLQRTLTNQGTSVTIPATGDPLEIYKDTTVIINFTGLGDVSGYTDVADKVWFTAKEHLDDMDASSIIQIVTTSPGDAGAASTLEYINGVDQNHSDAGSLLFTDYITGAATAVIKATAAANLPLYAADALYCDVKALKASTGIVSILTTGTMYIYGTPTRSIA